MKRYKRIFLKEGISLKGVKSNNPKQYSFFDGGLNYIVVSGYIEDEKFEVMGGSLQGNSRAFVNAMKKRGLKVVKRGKSSDYNILLPSSERAAVEAFLDSLNVKEMK